MAFGFITKLTGSFIGGFWLLLLGWFLQSGAQSYRQQSELAHALSAVRLKDIMNTAFVTVNPNMTVNELFTNYFNIYRKSKFPVIDKEGRLLGSIGTKEAMNVPEHSIDDVKVEEIKVRVGDLIVMGQNSYADEALKRMSKLLYNLIYCRFSTFKIMEKNGSKIRGGSDPFHQPVCALWNSSLLYRDEAISEDIDLFYIFQILCFVNTG
jgi:CBS domain-containing protein